MSSLGQERVVTKVAGNFSLPLAVDALARAPHSVKLRVQYFDRNGWLTSTADVDGASAFAHVDGGGERSFAVLTMAPQHPASA